MQFLTNRVRAGFVFLLMAGVVSALGVVVLSTKGVDAVTDAPYNRESMTANKTFEYEISTYHRFGPLATQIAGDLGIDVHPEHARLVGSMVADSDGEFGGSESKVYDQDQTIWHTIAIDADGNATTTNHRNGDVNTEILPASELRFKSGQEVDPLGETFEADGWTRGENGTFNGQPVEIYEILLPAGEREPASGIELPYVDDLQPVSFKERVMVSPTLNLVLKYDRWSVGPDNSSVLVETMEILKAKVE